jgi:hypothetical protein
MQIAPEITFEGSESSDAARAQILGELERLETHNHRITGCRQRESDRAEPQAPPWQRISCPHLVNPAAARKHRCRRFSV